MKKGSAGPSQPIHAVSPPTHFLQDGLPCHVSKPIKKLLADKPFEFMDWLVI
jgi:hypothetical protein